MSNSPQSNERPLNTFPRVRTVSSVYSGGTSEHSGSRHASISSQKDLLPRSSTALPSLASLTGEVGNARQPGRPPSPAAWRPLGVRNILNPTSDAPLSHGQPGPRSPQAGYIGAQRDLHPAPRSSPHVRKRGEPRSPAAESQVRHSARSGSRPILTPRSPSLKAVRAASIGGHRSPSLGAGGIHRVPLPSGDGRGYIAEPGDHRDAAVPPLPSLSAATAARAGISGMRSRELASHTTHASSRTSSGLSTGSLPPQQQDNRAERGRPPYPGGEGGPTGFLSNQGPALHQPAVGEGDSQANYMLQAAGPVRSGLPYGHDFQLTIDTQSGPLVVPVDYQQASRLADEKRKRNAGASARFRQRRKEKEQQANLTIAGLQQELQNMSDQREFYLQERNFFRDLLARTNPGPQPVRPHSPQMRRSHTVSSTLSDASPTIEYSHQEVELSSNSRRRVGEYQTSLPPLSPSTSFSASFPPPGPPLTLPALSAPTAFQDPRSNLGGPSPLTTRAPPYDPLRQNLIDREWNAGR